MSESLLNGTKGFRKFHKDNAPLFEKLSKGQEPRTIFVTCADSRVDPLLMTQSMPGDLFVIRTVGNIVPQHSKTSGEGASIEYAVANLPIDKIIVCSHSSCGAMGGLLALDKIGSMPNVKGWVEQCAPILDGVDRDNPDVVDITAKRNAEHQLDNLMTFPDIAQKVKDGSLQLLAWHFDIGSGQILEISKGSTTVLNDV